MKQYNGEKYIVSFTSFGERLKKIGRCIYILTQTQEYKNIHLVLTIYKNDIKYLTNDVKLLIDSDLLEVLIADEDLGPHLKYYYTMKKYYDKPIITVDDDRLYTSTCLSNLIKKYESLNYKSIISNCAIKIQKYGNKILPYPEWIPYRLKPNEKSIFAMAEGFAAVLYPEKCFANFNTKEFHDGILECKYDDDLYLKIQGIKNKIPVTQSNHIPGYTEHDNMSDLMQYNLHNNQNKGNINRINLCYKFEKDLLKAWSI